MWRTAGRVGAVGIEMAVAVAIGYLGGAWLDRKLGTEPVLGLVGLLLGVAAAGRALWSVTRKVRKGRL